LGKVLRIRPELLKSSPQRSQVSKLFSGQSAFLWSNRVTEGRPVGEELRDPLFDIGDTEARR